MSEISDLKYKILGADKNRTYVISGKREPAPQNRLSANLGFAASAPAPTSALKTKRSKEKIGFHEYQQFGTKNMESCLVNG